MHPILVLLAALLSLGSPLATSPAHAAACTPSVSAKARVVQEDGGEVLAIAIDLQAIAAVDGGDRLQAVRFVRADNAGVETSGGQVHAVPSTLSMAPASASGSFVVRKQQRGTPFMVRYVVTDSCGDVEKFSGAGTTASGAQPPHATATPPPPARASFSTEARISPAPAVPGTVATIDATVTSATATTALVDVEVYDPNGQKVFQQFFEDQEFAAGGRKAYAVAWPVPPGARPGPYRAVVAIFGDNWRAIEPWEHWTARATAFAVASTAAGTPAPATPAPPSVTAPAGFVTRRGAELVSDGRPFRFVGFNLFDAAGRPGGYHCAWWGALPDAELDATMGRMRAEAGATVLRFWAFQSYTAGGTDWAGLDRVVRLAKKHGIRLMPTIENGPEHCSEGGTKWHDEGRWYSRAYRRDYRYGYPLSLPEYTERLVARYKDEPAILGWTIMNEAETDNVAGLYDFAREMSTLVKRVDPNHLVALGTQSSGQAGTRGADFLRVHGLPTIDFVDGHDYAYWGDDANPLPGSPDGRTLPDPATCDNYRAIGCSIAQSIRLLGKPFIMGEAGIKAGVGGAVSTDRRAALLDAKLRAAFDNGVVGYVPWQLNRVVDEGYDVLFGDPLMAVLKRHAQAFGVSSGGAPPAPATAARVPATATPVPPTATPIP